jgi:hypothetical protein
MQRIVQEKSKSTHLTFHWIVYYVKSTLNRRDIGFVQ